MKKTKKVRNVRTSFLAPLESRYKLLMLGSVVTAIIFALIFFWIYFLIYVNIASS